MNENQDIANDGVWFGDKNFFVIFIFHNTTLEMAVLSHYDNADEIFFNSSPPGQNARHFRRHFQMHFYKWKVLYFQSNFTEVCS